MHKRKIMREGTNRPNTQINNLTGKGVIPYLLASRNSVRYRVNTKALI